MSTIPNLSSRLNPIQVSLLRLFDKPMSENETLLLKDHIVDYYSKLLTAEVTKVVVDKEYSQKDFDSMLTGESE